MRQIQMIKSDKPKKNYREEFLEDYKMLTGITDLTLQDVFGAMQIMFERRWLTQVKPSPWCKKQFMLLYQSLLDADDGMMSGMSHFKTAIEQTRYDRTHRQRKVNPETKRQKEEELLKHYYDDVEKNPEEDMSAMSDELLRSDDVYYQNESLLYKRFKSLNEAMFKYSALKMRQASEEYAERMISNDGTINIYYLVGPDNSVIGCRFKIEDDSSESESEDCSVTVIFKSGKSEEYVEITEDLSDDTYRKIEQYIKDKFNYKIEL